MIINNKIFFDQIRPLFGNKLDIGQVKGMEQIIAAAPDDFPLNHLAYALATTKIETAHTMLPIKERGGDAYFKKMYDIEGSRPGKARELGNLTPGDGARYCGRGDVQLTGKSNYKKATDKLRAMGFDVDFVKFPDTVMLPQYAALILFVGMTEGWFTGKKLSDYLGPDKDDAHNARKIINGLDRAAEIATVYRAFYGALLRAWLGASEQTPQKPVLTGAGQANEGSPSQSPVITKESPPALKIEPVKIPVLDPPYAAPMGETRAVGALRGFFERLFGKR